MASTEGPTRAHDRHGRRRPFSNWMKRLANLKNSNADSATLGITHRRNTLSMSSKSKKLGQEKNNPYCVPTRQEAINTGHLSFQTPLSSQRSRSSSLSKSKYSPAASHDSHANGPTSSKSRPPTLSTTAETVESDAAASKAATSATAARTDGARNSTFSSPSPSLRSLTTTLTTVQSAAPPSQANGSSTYTGTTAAATSGGSMLPPSHFTHQFTASPPATAIPAHLAPHNHPATYNSATANNMLSDDASILTLASSSKRRRRNSLDTNASIRALAPASMFGGSRESLPLSVLSGIVIDPSNASASNAAGVLRAPAANSIANAERTSLISSSGPAPALASDRNSYYAGKQGGGDGASVRSGLAHTRNDSITNSIGGVVPTSPLSSVLPGPPPGKVSRRGSGADEVPDKVSDDKQDEGQYSQSRV